MFGPSLVNSSSEKGKDRPFNEHFDYLLELGVFHANQSLLYRRDLITTVSDQVWDKVENQETQKWLRKWVPPSHNAPGSSVLKKVDSLLAEVQADWEDLKEMLSRIEAIGRYNRLLT